MRTFLKILKTIFFDGLFTSIIAGAPVVFIFFGIKELFELSNRSGWNVILHWIIGSGLIALSIMELLAIGIIVNDERKDEKDEKRSNDM